MNAVTRKVLVIDDEPAIRDSLRLLLKAHFDVTTAEDGEKGLAAATESLPDLILLDVNMPVLDGMGTLKALREKNITAPVIMLTGAATVQLAVEAMKFGAADFLNKPFDIAALTTLIFSLLEKNSETTTSEKATNSSTETSPSLLSPVSTPPSVIGDRTIVGKSKLITEMLKTIDQVAVKDSTVLITGESGTGKELIAKRLHEKSRRSAKPFIALNCAAIPETLIESELFGHEKGSFTGAHETRLGQCELADGGTLFLDEIGELSLAMQVKFLRFLQEREFQRVGRSKPIAVDVRIICATNRNLEQMVEEKKFRQDLFYRINVIGLGSPSLKERYEDIPVLIEHFQDKLAKQYDNRRLTFSQEAIDELTSYQWSGNIRELENLVESLMALSPTDTILPEHLPAKIFERSANTSSSQSAFVGSLKFDDAERQFESEMILKALKRTNFVQTRAAELLGISRRILKYKMDKLGITEKLEELN